MPRQASVLHMQHTGTSPCMFSLCHTAFTSASYCRHGRSSLNKKHTDTITLVPTQNYSLLSCTQQPASLELCFPESLISVHHVTLQDTAPSLPDAET